LIGGKEIGKRVLFSYLKLLSLRFLYENGRVDNIFTDRYYEPFSSALHEVIKGFSLPVNELGYFVTRIEEEHLWESKQLGAHSPQVLLNTLVYYNVKYFMLKTTEQHQSLSFSQVVKQYINSSGRIVNANSHCAKTCVLRYNPTNQRSKRTEDRRWFEQQENQENPLRCPVKLYEFYVSKW